MRNDLYNLPFVHGSLLDGELVSFATATASRRRNRITIKRSDGAHVAVGTTITTSVSIPAEKESTARNRHKT